MLFLAVTIGFYAENLREVNKHRHEAVTNMRSLLSDLRTDIQLFDSVIDRNDYSIAMSDTLVSLLHNDLSRTDDIYYAARSVTANIGYFYTNSKSFEQMKGANLTVALSPQLYVATAIITAVMCAFAALLSIVKVLRLDPASVFKA